MGLTHGLKPPCYIEAKAAGSDLKGPSAQTSEVCETSEVWSAPA